MIEDLEPGSPSDMDDEPQIIKSQPELNGEKNFSPSNSISLWNNGGSSPGTQEHSQSFTKKDALISEDQDLMMVDQPV